MFMILKHPLSNLVLTLGTYLNEEPSHCVIKIALCLLSDRNNNCFLQLMAKDADEVNKGIHHCRNGVDVGSRVP
jgi:hypothetical protein